MGTVPVPKTITNDRIEQFINIFDFEMDENEMATLDAFYMDERQKILEEEMGRNKEFPIYLGKIRKFNQDD